MPRCESHRCTFHNRQLVSSIVIIIFEADILDEGYTSLTRPTQVILVSKNSAEKHMNAIFSCTRGIIFLGTPHGGSGLAEWGKGLACSIGFIKQANSDILEVLKTESEILDRIQSDFHNSIRTRADLAQPIDITCFFEELPLPGIGTVRVVMVARLLCS